ncbi:hypothetical protein PAXRUDRAFT_739027 [Paxillus rubicundulus Ve08.2h10]|uniref:Uncharacterized protein n=1 Tax=Paxillus rubicundulus Ve08.2h10 TaxID=930991 RepID=A0A0D0D1E8_9AGAM|nr:hypothetical protein PAXRUDRAFT_739027 [Paxillus rubicundulus Ve08.2h10]
MITMVHFTAASATAVTVHRLDRDKKVETLQAGTKWYKIHSGRHPLSDSHLQPSIVLLTMKTLTLLPNIIFLTVYTLLGVHAIKEVCPVCPSSVAGADLYSACIDDQNFTICRYKNRARNFATDCYYASNGALDIHSNHNPSCPKKVALTNPCAGCNA